MARLEDKMAGLFGGNEAAGLDDIRRRKGAQGQGPGYEGIGGAMVGPGQMMPYYQGIGQYDFSGAFGRDFQGGRGLQALLAEAQGPALRHFARQGFDFMPPGFDQREKPGGPNIAPGNIENAQALDQPQGNQFPGVPQGVARGYESAPGQGVRMNPQTQGWRNIHPGYSAAAAYGSGGPQDYLHGFGGRAQSAGAPAAAQSAPPGATGKGGGQGIAGGGGGGGAPTKSQNPIGGGGAPVAPAGSRGAGQGTGGGGKGKATGAGGGGQPGPAQTAGLSTRPGSAGPDLPGNATEANQANTIKAGVRTQRKQAVANAYEDTQNGVNNLFGNTIHLGQEPSGQGGKGISGSTRGTAHERRVAGEGKLAGLSPAEKAARKAAWEQRVASRQEAKAERQAEKARLAAAPSASQFGTRASGGLEPLPQSGSTRPKGSHPRGASAGRRY